MIPKIINKSVLAKELNISKQLLDWRIKKGFTEHQKQEIIIILKKYLTDVK
jgi:hypothetical protein